MSDLMNAEQAARAAESGVAGAGAEKFTNPLAAAQVYAALAVAGRLAELTNAVDKLDRGYGQDLMERLASMDVELANITRAIGSLG